MLEHAARGGRGRAGDGAPGRRDARADRASSPTSSTRRARRSRPRALVASTPRRRPVRVVPCEVRYPQGAERQLVAGAHRPRGAGARAADRGRRGGAERGDRGRGVRRGALPQPLLDRVVTVTGPGVAARSNLRVPIGTLLQRPGRVLRRAHRRRPRASWRAGR